MQMNTINRIYQEFYGKEPDFSEMNFRNLTIEMQAMAYILNQLGICFVSYTFWKEGYIDLTLPMSMDLQDMLVYHRIKKQEENEKTKEKLKESARKKIALAGNVVRKNMEGTPQPIETLRQIVYMNFARNQMLPNATEERLASLPDCELGTIIREKSMMLDLQNEMAKENFGETNLASVTQNIESNDISDKAYRPIPNERGPVHVFVSKESRKKCARDLVK